MSEYFIGVDVGTGSVRAGVFDISGHCVGTGSKEISMFSDSRGLFVEQSTDEIWSAACQAVRDAVSDSPSIRSNVTGIAFDATCSLAVVDGNFEPVPLDEDGTRNVIVWMDHRAEEDAAFINDRGHEVLRQVGGSISPEMEPPKLRWLARNRPHVFSQASHFLDLCDFITIKATGDYDTPVRSLCTVTCKWTYVPGSGWKESFWDPLHPLLSSSLSKGAFGTDVRTPGNPLGMLSHEAAEQMSLLCCPVVTVGMIDAHAGVVGALGAGPSEYERSIVVVGGTSACHMSLTPYEVAVPGVWGPYQDVIFESSFLLEAGQSAVGALLDVVLARHPAGSSVGATHESVTSEILRLGDTPLERAMLTSGIHLYPDFHGNRSPLADPAIRGVMAGLSLAVSNEDLARWYLAAVQGIAYSTRDIVESINKRRDEGQPKLECVILTGSMAKNEIFVENIADVLQMPVLFTKESENMLLGCAILAAVGAGKFSDTWTAMKAMSQLGRRLEPNTVLDEKLREYHEKKYLVYKRMQDDVREYRNIMK